MEDSLWHTLIDYNIKTPMGMTAENLAAKYAITREQCDEFALHSQNAYQQGHCSLFELNIKISVLNLKIYFIQTKN